MKTMLKLWLVTTVFFLSSCTTAMQGIQGTITKATEANMPGADTVLNSGIALSTNVLVTIALAEDELNKNAKGLYERPDERLVIKEGRTDSKGNFSINLTPGVYSVLIETPDGWYAKESDENGVLNKVTVEKKQVVTQNITIDY